EALSRQKNLSAAFEIIVVNNDPADLPPDWVSLPQNARIIDESRPGAYAARNAGISIASGRILAFTDADCVPKETWLGSALGFFEANRHLSRLGGRIELVHTGSLLTTAAVYDLV